MAAYANATTEVVHDSLTVAGSDEKGKLEPKLGIKVTTLTDSLLRDSPCLLEATQL